ncbi:MAG: CoA transferase [Dehalococcoidia bacterium]
MENKPLSGLRVLDLSEFVSGPYCTKLLASFGAEVIKTEEIAGGDVSRRFGPYPNDLPDREKSGLFLYLNTNKKSITINRQTKAGNDILNQLAARADIVVANRSPGVPHHQFLLELNPELIICSISYFGHTGPYREYKGCGIVAQAIGGIMRLTGLPESAPLKIAGPQAEYQAGINSAISIMGALLYRDETGRGDLIEISVLECLASILEGALLSYEYDSTLTVRDGGRHPTIYPSTILPCKEGYVHVDSSGDWDTFTRFTGIPEFGKLEPDQLREHADEIDRLLTDWLSGYTREEIFHLAQEWRLPFAEVMRLDELPDDRQMTSREFFVDNLHPEAGVFACPGAPFRMSEYQPQTARAPLLGEHNREIYCDLLGYTVEDLVRLRGMGII